MKKDVYVIYGPIGSNKTVQARQLAARLNICNISWGNIYRELPLKERNKIDSIKNEKNRSYVISKLINKEIARNNDKSSGFILDGYPRTTTEARNLITIINKYNFSLKGLIKLNSSLKIIKERISNTLYCYKCGRSYTNNDNSFSRGLCEYDNQKLELIHKSDDGISNDFYSYLKTSDSVFKILAPYSETFFSVSDMDDNVVTFANIVIKLENKIKEKNNIYKRQSAAKLSTKFGEFEIISYQSQIDYQYHLALVMGNVAGKKSVLTRVHSSCITGDILGSLKCDCGDQLNKSLQLISDKKQGVLLYLLQEGRGINIINKIMAYDLQRHGFDTVGANEKLGFPSELRQYDMVKKMLDDLKISSICLLTNNPDKIHKLTDLGVIIDDVCSIEIQSIKQNRKYLRTKKEKMGHNLLEFSDK